MRGICNTIIKEFNQGDNHGNIIRISIDIELPDTVTGKPFRFKTIIETLSYFLSDNLVNGIITLSISGKVISENVVAILFTFFAHDSNAVLQVTDSVKKNKTESDLKHISTDLDIDVQLKVVHQGIQLTLREILHEPFYPVARQTHPLKGRCILLAEDNEINAMVFISFLEDWGIQTIHVLDGQEALNRLQETRFDLILMDINMPVMNGIEAIYEIRKTDRIIPILVLTASTMEQDISFALEAGANGYIQKPVSSSQLSKLLSLHLK